MKITSQTDIRKYIMQRNHQVSFGLFVVIYYFDIHVRPSLWQRPSRHTSDFYHVQSSRSPVRPLLSEAKPILNFKTTWSEF